MARATSLVSIDAAHVLVLGPARYLGLGADQRSAVYELPARVHRLRALHRTAGRLIALLALARVVVR